MTYQAYSFRATLDSAANKPKGLQGHATWNDRDLYDAVVEAWLNDLPILLVNPGAAELPSVRALLCDAGLVALADGRTWQAPPSAPILSSLRSGFHALLLTSGTTGQPQLVALDRASIEFNVKALTRHLSLPLASPMRVLCHVPIFHAFGLTLCFLQALLNKQELLFTARFSAAALMDTLQHPGEAFLPLVPAQARSLVALARGRTLAAGGVSVIGGDSVDADLRRELAAILPHMSHTVGYGLTEAGPVLCHTTRGDPELSCEVGRPLPGIRLLRPTFAAGAWFQSPGQCCAIWNKTAGAWSPTRGAWLPTGDVLRESSGGSLQFVGRAKSIIKKNGETIFPLAVEDALAKATGYEYALIMTSEQDKANGDTLLVLTVESRESESSVAAVQGAIMDLPSFFRPDRVVWTGSLSRTSLGKIERRTSA